MTKTRELFDKYKKYFCTHFYAHEKGGIGRQRIIVFLYSSVFLVIAVILNLCGVAGPISPFFQVANAIQGFLTVLWLYLYYSDRISLTTAISLFCLALQLEISAETIYCAIYQSHYDISLIIANIALSSIILLLSIITYLRIVPYVIVVLSLSTFVFSIYQTGSEVLANFFLVFFVIFLALTLLGRSMARNVAQLDHENFELKDERQDILDVFHLTVEEMHSYISLARNKGLEPEKTAEILTAVGSVAEKRIRDNVAHYIRQSSIEFDKIQERLPELTPSELEICSLILKEKKLKEISEMLGKSRSNITCQRTNIRTKLNMKSGDNLYEMLKNRMEHMEQETASCDK